MMKETVIFCALVVAGLWFFAVEGPLLSAPVESPPPVGEEESAAASIPESAGKGVITLNAVVRMDDVDWWAHFAQTGHPADPMERREVVRLGSELRQSVIAGVPADSPEVSSKFEKVRLLLSPPGSPEKPPINVSESGTY